MTTTEFRAIAADLLEENGFEAESKVLRYYIDPNYRPRISQMTSPSTGNPVANQFEISDHSGRWFQSYKTLIVHIENSGTITLDRGSWNYSVTTSRYRNRFLGETTEEITAKVNSGEYKLADLNR